MWLTHEDLMIRSPFPRMTDVLVPGEKGMWKLEVMEVDKRTEDFSKMRESIGHRGEYCPAGSYMKLTHGGGIVMTDTKIERDSNRVAFAMSRGHVLIGGLGMGMVMCAIQKKPEVSSVTVVEKDQDVIDLMMECGLPVDNDKTVIQQGDVFDWEPGFTFKYDTLYFDVWNNICSDNKGQFKELRKKYRKYRAKGSWIGFWAEDMI